MKPARLKLFFHFNPLCLTLAKQSVRRSTIHSLAEMTRLLTKCALFMPDAALTPYPTYKIVQIQYIAGTM
ncbi:hypothetical protein BV389_04905 [Escherichia coli]|nr:hypothetical protein BV389_04905 [Escherichia coli]